MIKQEVILIILVFLFFSISLINSQEINTIAIVEVNTIYAFFLDVEVISDEVFPGENLIVLIRLNKTGKPEEISVNLDYKIFNESFSVIDSRTLDSINISEHIEKNITIGLPSNISSGNYSIEIKASHEQAVSSSDTDNFFVKSLLCGDLNNDNEINLADILFLVSYLFQGGQAPDPLWIADVDASGQINIADLTYLVAYVFFGGAEPVCEQQDDIEVDFKGKRRRL